jgi:hypothetical protein
LRVSVCCFPAMKLPSRIGPWTASAKSRPKRSSPHLP